VSSFEVLRSVRKNWVVLLGSDDVSLGEIFSPLEPLTPIASRPVRDKLRKHVIPPFTRYIQETRNIGFLGVSMIHDTRNS
jgi:hypothetical protein